MKFTFNTFRSVAFATILAFTGTAFAQSGKPLKIVIGTPAGASMDTLTRLIAEKIKVTLNRPVVVENKAGAAGRIAAEAVKAAPADGSTVWITASANVVAQPLAYSNLKYDPFKRWPCQPVQASTAWATTWPTQRRTRPMRCTLHRLPAACFISLE